MRLKYLFILAISFCACSSGPVRDRDVPKADTHSPYVPQRDSGL